MPCLAEAPFANPDFIRFPKVGEASRESLSLGKVLLCGVDGNRVIIPRQEICMQTNELGEGFGEWLVKQVKRDDWIGTLAKSAKADLRFRSNSPPDDLRKRLQEAGAEGDTFEALDDAETEWLSAT